MKPVVLIKTGGKVAVKGPELTNLIGEIGSLISDYNFILVHGGGAEVTATSKIHGLEAKFIDGVRMTTNQEMEIVDGVLAGRINKRLVRNFESLGVPAVGISGNDGQTFIGESIDPKVGNRTGRVIRSNPHLLETLIGAGFVPVISSVSMDDKGESLNINADEAALSVSKSIKASKVIFISDIPGILKDDEVLQNMTESTINKEIKDGVISGGMIPKVKASLDAIKHGVKTVTISNYINKGDLKLLIDNKKGSLIREEQVWVHL